MKGHYSAQVTVEDIIKLALPAGARVIAGETGLGREVTWAVAQRSRLPAFPSLTGGEIALISMGPFRQIHADLPFPQLVRQLAERGIAALAVVGDIPAGSEELANDLSIPLLALPEGTSLRELESLISRTVTERRTEMYKWEMELHRRFTRLSVEAEGVAAIVEALADITAQVALFEDDSFDVQFASGDLERLGLTLPLPADSALAEWLGPLDVGSSEALIRKVPFGDTPLARLVAPIVMRRKVVGYLSLLGPADELDGQRRYALSSAASACAMEMARKFAVLEVENRFKGEFIDSLVEGTFQTLDEAASRGKGLGYDPARQYVVAVARLDPEKKPKLPALRGRVAVAQRAAEYAAVFCDELARLNGECLVRAREDVAIALCSVNDEGSASATKVEETLEKARQVASARIKGSEGSIGLGRYHAGLRGVCASYGEAKQALAIAQSLLGGQRTAYFGALGAYRLLFKLKDSSELRDFYQETLGKLAEHDQKSGGDLLQTLETFFACHGNVEKTAETLFLHRNTLAYRLRRVEQTTGLRLKDMEDSFRLQLALKIRKVIETLPPPS
jgi:PucR family transcriptional regulator, purine catabolism regulatory protein